jgi:cleavage and polyadenylation specificity factor subunit 1
LFRRLKERKDNTWLFIVSLDLVAKQYQVIVTVENLPYDALYLSPCPNAIGGVVVATANSIIHVDQASKITALPFSGWAKRVTDLIMVGEEPIDDIHLEGSRSTFLTDTKLLVVLVDGTMHEVDFEHEGRLVRRLVLHAPIGVASPPSAVLANSELVFIASTSHHSVLLNLPSLKGGTVAQNKPSTTGGANVEFGMQTCQSLLVFYLYSNQSYMEMRHWMAGCQDRRPETVRKLD